MRGYTSVGAAHPTFSRETDYNIENERVQDLNNDRGVDHNGSTSIWQPAAGKTKIWILNSNYRYLLQQWIPAI